MADVIGQIEERLGLTEFLGSDRFIVPGGNQYAHRSADGFTPSLLPGDADRFIANGTREEFDQLNDFERPSECYDALPDDRWDLADVWFDLVFVRPSVFEFGNILSTQTEPVTVYSSYRSQTISLNSIVNNLGAGVNLLGLPSIPATIQPQSGFDFTLEVTTDGAPTLNDTIDFVFDVDTQQILVTGQRIVMFPLRPEAPMSERLTFLTDVMENIDGSEQRVRSRRHPRQEFIFRMAVDTENRQFLENLLYDWQSRVFGVPVWTDPSFLTAPASVGQTSVNVDDTSLGDFRVGDLAIVLTDRFTFDALEVQAVNPASITFTSPLNNNYPTNTQVLPLRPSYAVPLIRGTRSLNEDERLEIRFRVINNNVGDSFADSSAFNTLNNRILLDGPNAADRGMSVQLQRRLVEFDNQVGQLGLLSPWSRQRKSSVKGFVSHSRQELWNIRRLLHDLHGRQVAFYMPTFQNEMTLLQPPQLSQNTLTINNVGFARHAKQQSPSRSILRLIQNDGTILTRNITSSGEVDALTETITVDEVWPATIPLEDIARIDYVELVRADTDEFELRHVDGVGGMRLSFPVKTVFE